ncbi:hypothetical protein CIL05_07610 [Virgibacillus profundi]|uniref:Uncharacterized protein n=1 Tax=Virgibacillus profundi TaxID=2024555 RepID=A0A2A2IG37_9BACI|nr:hypothetical protein CIL05_07610 [Virgibacillus profundi]PXY54500.1 hypothetical protein CIT14_07695 [Virgibacillus profundi]
MNNNILTNVKYILDNYGEHITNDKQLILMYWKIIDEVEISKTFISTVDFLNLSTNVADILSGKILLEIMEKEGL